MQQTEVRPNGFQDGPTHASEKQALIPEER